MVNGQQRQVSGIGISELCIQCQWSSLSKKLLDINGFEPLPDSTPACFWLMLDVRFSKMVGVRSSLVRGIDRSRILVAGVSLCWKWAFKKVLLKSIKRKRSSHGSLFLKMEDMQFVLRK